jgi:hypothetical protein
MSDDVIVQHLREQLKAMTERAERAETHAINVVTAKVCIEKERDDAVRNFKNRIWAGDDTEEVLTRRGWYSPSDAATLRARAEKAEARVKVFCDLLGRDTVTDRAEDDLEIALQALDFHSVVGSIDEVVNEVLVQKEQAETEVLKMLKEIADLRGQAHESAQKLVKAEEAITKIMNIMLSRFGKRYRVMAIEDVKPGVVRGEGVIVAQMPGREFEEVVLLAETTIQQLETFWASSVAALREKASRLWKVANGVFVGAPYTKAGIRSGPWRCMDCVGESDEAPDKVAHGRHRNDRRECAMAEFEDLK